MAFKTQTRISKFIPKPLSILALVFPAFNYNLISVARASTAFSSNSLTEAGLFEPLHQQQFVGNMIRK
jgi:hypothetical protein